MGFFNKVLKSSGSIEASRQSPTDSSSPNSRFAVIDVETSGLNPDENRIIELAIITATPNQIIDKWVLRFNPEGPVGPTHIHGITQADVKDSPRFRDKTDEIIRKIDGIALVAHNARFDLAFLRSELERSGWNVPWMSSICTLEASRYYLPHLPRRRLIDCCEELDIEINGQHSALGDAEATAKLLFYYLDWNKEPEPRDKDLNTISDPSRRPFTKGMPKSSPKSPHTNYNVTPKRDVSESAAYEALVRLLAACSFSDVVDHQFADGSVAYLEKVIEALEDGVISEEESLKLSALEKIYGLNPNDVSIAHRSLVKALALQALEDESISASERTELIQAAASLRIPQSAVTTIIKEAREIRAAKLSRRLEPLPSNWSLGEPLRVGNKVVFTGCDVEQRFRLETISKQLGVTISSNVTSKTNLLVTDGSYSGNKARDAEKLGVRVVHPDQYEIFIKFLQPAIS